MDYDGDGSRDNEQYTAVNAMSTEKRIFHRHSPQQIQILEAYFKKCPHPNESQRQALCKELDLEIDQIKFWFQNKRTQSKAQDERNSNILLRVENEKIQCENDVMLEALKNVTCPPCGGPPFGRDERERERSFQKQRLEHALLKRERDILADTVAKIKYQETMMDSLQRHQTFETLTTYGFNPNNPLERPSLSESQTIQPQLLPQMDILQLSATAASAVEELKQLFSTEEALWVMSSIDGTYVIEQDSYEKFSHSIKHFRNSSARVESSKVVTVVPIEATSLIDIFLDSEKWKNLFPTIVNKAATIYTAGSELPVKETCNVLQVICEQLHILSPLVAPREFMIVRCCRQIDEGLWIIADVSQTIINPDQASPSCYKRPSGVLIRALPNAQSQVTWIEHVEVDHTPETHQMYRDLVSGGWGYGAKRWIVTLERMCERMALSSILNMPATNMSETIATAEGRRRVMELGERILKNFNEMLIMSGNVVFPQQSKCGGVRISTRMNMEADQLAGLVVSAASCLSIPLTPLQVFNGLTSNDIRHQWDVLCHGKAITEVARVFTGSSETNYINLLQPTVPGDVDKSMVQNPKTKLMMLQECYMDALGGMIVYSPLDMATMSIVASGEIDPLKIPILPSGFTISRDSQGSTGAEDGGTLLTLAFQIIFSRENSRTRNENENSVDTVNRLISGTVQRIKDLFNCPPE